MNYEIYTGEVEALTDDQKLALQAELQAIRDAFVSDMFEPVVTTQYITSTYNKAHKDAPINGNTVEAVLAFEAPASEAPIEGA